MSSGRPTRRRTRKRPLNDVTKEEQAIVEGDSSSAGSLRVDNATGAEALERRDCSPKREKVSDNEFDAYLQHPRPNSTPFESGLRSSFPGSHQVLELKLVNPSSTKSEGKVQQCTIHERTCPICYLPFRDCRRTLCGHAFCLRCVVAHLTISKKCPVCGSVILTGGSTVDNIPDGALVREDSDVRQPPAVLRVHMDNINLVAGVLSDAKLPKTYVAPVEQKLSERRKEVLAAEQVLSHKLLGSALDGMITSTEKQMRLLEEQLSKLREDRALVDSEPQVPAVIEPYTITSMEDRVSRYNKCLETTYSQLYPIIDTNDEKVSVVPTADDSTTTAVNSVTRVQNISSVIRGILKYGSVERLAILNYDRESAHNMSIVSSLEFNHDGEMFVVAGVTRRIKIFKFSNVVSSPNGPHYPLVQLKSRSKISNVSWNPEHLSKLACSDYDGHVSVWDVNQSRVVKCFQEHEKRVWSVNFNSVDANLLASGSDDAKVKIWSMNQDRSVACIDARVNVCCVQFNPYNRNQLAFGSADHSVHIYDIRNCSHALQTMQEHRKAVAYVRYLNEGELVSASTDSTLCVWDIGGNKCKRVLRGHANEKNFVGLGSFGDHIICGSENNRVYFYHKDVSEPLFNHAVTEPCELLAPPIPVAEHSGERFVSSVCWRKDTNECLVANSLGCVQLLRLH